MKNISKGEALRKLPPGFIRRIELEFSQSELEKMVRGFAASRNPVIRVNPLASEPDQTLRNLRSQNIVLERIAGLSNAYEVKNRNEKMLLALPEAEKGEFLLQGISSQIPVHYLAPRKGEKIWDMCAAPGSKTTQIAAQVGGDAEIIASEIDTIRFQKLQNMLKVQKCEKQVQVFHMSAITLGKQFENYFDAILLDAPCSAEGRIDLHDPATYRYWSEKNITAHAKLQRQLFRAAVKALKPGGRIVYSTCTLAPEENEGIVEWALQEFSEEIKFISLKSQMPFVREKNGMLYILPNEKMEGFFLACFQGTSF